MTPTTGTEICIAKFKDDKTDLKVSLMQSQDTPDHCYGRIMCFMADDPKRKTGTNSVPPVGFKISMDDMETFRSNLETLLLKDPIPGKSFIVPKQNDPEQAFLGKHMVVQNIVSRNTGKKGLRIECRQGNGHFLIHYMVRSCANKLLEELTRYVDMWKQGQIKWSKMKTFNSLEADPEPPSSADDWLQGNGSKNGLSDPDSF
ncbi:hypothetical protein Dalk_1304 [Desulfatibacillum aliphaticivorans]|uniref:Uncharacterized protein n=1 Tax=Desulfatibacillum aliphaticivorans TaxID=218208 RepID=B8F9R1_DESAL|nr:hypothetical protein [Desulfatibacillum aliphaticivorans]ACL03007.1 hypothetical protein Dalk_1304 [Desulfatibacillum aliphaticivorans]